MLEKMPKCRRCEIYDPKPGVMSKRLDEDAVEHLLLLVLSISAFSRHIWLRLIFYCCANERNSI